jgi:hypothetical protein
VTKATQEGRRLRLEVDGIEEPFYVDPLPARRGRDLTAMFVDAAIGQLDPISTAAVFMECLGPANYARMNGSLVDAYSAQGEWVRTYSPEGPVDRPPSNLGLPGGVPAGTLYLAREDDSVEGEAIRQEEGESLAIAAFYWQTAAGMEAVNQFIENGEGSVGFLKALNVLMYRLGLSPSRTSPNSELASLMQTDDTVDTTTRNGGGTLAKLPPNRRSRRRKTPKMSWG